MCGKTFGILKSVAREGSPGSDHMSQDLASTPWSYLVEKCSRQKEQQMSSLQCEREARGQCIWRCEWGGVREECGRQARALGAILGFGPFPKREGGATGGIWAKQWPDLAHSLMGLLGAAGLWTDYSGVSTPWSSLGESRSKTTNQICWALCPKTWVGGPPNLSCRKPCWTNAVFLPHFSSSSPEAWRKPKERKGHWVCCAEASLIIDSPVSSLNISSSPFLHKKCKIRFLEFRLFLKSLHLDLQICQYLDL